MWSESHRQAPPELSEAVRLHEVVLIVDTANPRCIAETTPTYICADAFWLKTNYSDRIR